MSLIECEPCSAKARECFTKVVESLAAGEHWTLTYLKDRLVGVGLEVIHLEPRDICEYFRPDLAQLQEQLTRIPGPRGSIVTTVDAMTREEVVHVLGLIGALGIVTGALPIDRTQLNS